MLVKPSPPHDRDPVDDLTDFVTLVSELQNPNSSVRRQAVHALRDTPSAVLVLCRLLETETDASVRSVVLTALIRMKSGDVAERLANLLRSEDVALRNAVIEALQSMPDEALPKLGELLEDPDSDVRLFAINIITGIHHISSRPLLAHVLREETHVNVCLAALDGLPDIADEDLIPTLIAFAARFPAVPLVQHAVTASIRRIRGPQ